MILQIEGLRFAYPEGPDVVSGWSAAIGPGVTELHGDTGSGKTVLLRVLAGELPASAGRLAIHGVALADAPARYRSQVFHSDPSTPRFDQVTARDCILALGGDGAGDAAPHTARQAARQAGLVDGFGLGPHIDKPLYMLSTGSRRKVFLTAALLSARPLTLLDEPTAALDTGSIECLWAALADIAQRGDRAVIVASSARLGGLRLAASFVLPF